jgi:hypothetical protein
LGKLVAQLGPRLAPPLGLAELEQLAQRLEQLAQYVA